MGDFATKSVSKSSERVLANPIADITSFQSLVQGVLDSNPWGCTAYEEAGSKIQGVVRKGDTYTGKVVYQNDEARVIGAVTIKAPSVAGFGTAISTVLANADIRASIGGTPAHDSSEDTFSCSLRCHDPSGEIYSVTFKRDRVVVASYEAESIIHAVETWADGIVALA